MKQQHLSEALGLSDDQQAKIKPTLEQESGEAGTILWDPVLSRKDKLKRYEKLVAASDAKIKPILSTIYNSGGQASGASQTTKGGAQKAYRRAKRRQAKLICS
jgi:hypothetical protein